MSAQAPASDSIRQNHQMENRKKIFALIFCALVFGICSHASGQQKSSQASAKSTPAQPIPNEIMLRMVRAEDERRYDNDLGVLLFDKDARVRQRAALAAGRIGDERAVASLATLLQTDKEASVRAMAAFALGEIESVTGAAALSEALEKTNETNEVRARSLEALGKIAAALPKSDEARSHAIGEIILKTLGDELNRSPKPNREVVLLGLTATLRARPTGASSVVAKLLSSTDARVRGDAENTLARLRSNESTGQLRQLLASDPDPIVRANAARA